MKKIVLVSIMLMALLSAIVTANGAGITPSTLNFKEVLKGKEYTRSLTVFALGYDEAPNMNLDFEMDIFDYELVSVEEYSPRGFKYKYDITLKPKGLKLGEYESKVKAYADCGGNGVSICVGVEGNIKFIVTKEKILTPYVDSILTRDTYYGVPHEVRYGLGCYGNIPCRYVIKIDTGIYNKTKRVTLEPYSSGTFNSYTDIDEYPTGYYLANTKIYVKDKGWKLIAEKSPHFRIFESCEWDWCR